AKHHDSIETGQPRRLDLSEALPLGRYQHDRLRLSRILPYRVDRLEQRRGLQDHARTAAIRNVVDRAVPVLGELAQVPRANRQHVALNRPCENALRKRRLDHSRKNRDDIESHQNRQNLWRFVTFTSSSPSGGSTTTFL